MKYCIAKLTLVQSSDVYDYEQEGPPRAHRTPITRRAFSLSNDHTLLGETGWLNTSEYKFSSYNVLFGSVLPEHSIGPGTQ